MRPQSLMYQYHSNNLYACWRQLQRDNGIWGSNRPYAVHRSCAAINQHASGRPRSTRFRPNSPFKAAIRRIPKYCPLSIHAITAAIAMKPNINRPVAGANEFYVLNEPRIGTTLSPVRALPCH